MLLGLVHPRHGSPLWPTHSAVIPASVHQGWLAPSAASGGSPFVVMHGSGFESRKLADAVDIGVKEGSRKAKREAPPIRVRILVITIYGP